MCCHGAALPLATDAKSIGVQHAVDLSHVSIILLSYNRKEQLRRNLNCLIALAETSHCELIIVDNASTDGSSQAIANMATGRRNVRFVINGSNLGASEGRNTGWRIATRELFICIDEDIIISAQAIATMVAAARQATELGVISPDIVDSLTGRTINTRRHIGDGGEKSFYEACFLLPRAIIERVGYLDPALTVAGEGLDYSLRLRKAGYKIKRITSVRAVHVDRTRTRFESADRRKKWLWCFCYVYWKNMGAVSATLRSTRIFLAHSRAGAKLFGISFVTSLPRIARAGARAGRLARENYPRAASLD